MAWIQNTNNIRINPATEDKQDDIITAIENIVVPAPVGGATADNQINGTQKTQIVDAGGEQVTVTGGKLDVNASIDTTGLATSAKQLADNHQVTVSNQPSEFPLPAGQVVTLTPPAAITGFATENTLAAIPGLSIPIHDYIGLSYTGNNLTGVIYKTGGSGGTTVATLTLSYTGSILDSITKV